MSRRRTDTLDGESLVFLQGFLAGFVVAVAFAVAIFGVLSGAFG